MTDPVRPQDLTCDDVRDLAGGYVLGALGLLVLVALVLLAFWRGART